MPSSLECGHRLRSSNMCFFLAWGCGLGVKPLDSKPPNPQPSTLTPKPHCVLQSWLPPGSLRGVDVAAGTSSKHSVKRQSLSKPLWILQRVSKQVTTVERIWNIQYGRGRILAMTFRKKSLRPFQMFLLRSEAACERRCAASTWPQVPRTPNP